MTDIRRTIAVIAALLMAAFAAAQDMGELRVDHALTFQFSTPHTDWAQPYAGGYTRVLFFTDGRGTRPRECVELMQRFDIDAQAVFWARIVDSPESHWHGGATGRQRMLRLLGQDWDCFVFVNIDPAKMSAQEQYRVIKPVTEGAGLVLVGCDDERVLKPKNRIQDGPAFLRGGAVGDAYTVGAGRGIRLPGRPSIDYYPGWEVEYDYWSERLGRAILWAAGNEPKAQLQLNVSPPQFLRGAGATATIGATGECIGHDLQLRIRYRRHAADPLPEDLANQTQAIEMPSEATFELPLLPAGDYHLDAWLESSAGTEAWATVPFRITAQRNIDSIELDSTWAEIDGTIAGTVTCVGKAQGDETVRVMLLDHRRRILRMRDFAPTEQAIPFDFNIEPWMPMLVTVEAVILRDGAEVARDDTFFHIVKRNRGRFNFLIWDYPRGTLAPAAERSLAENSVTLQLAGGAPPDYIAAHNIAWVPYTTRIMAKRGEDGIMQPFCWNDDQAVQKHVQEKAQAYVGARQHGVFVYSLGDEVDTQGACVSDHCMRAYREYLKKQYGDLESLNVEWQTDFEDWDDVGLSREGDNEEANALQKGNYPRWFDRQAFKSYNMVQFCQDFARAYKQMDPKAKTGFEGAGRFARGDDLDLIIRENDFWNPYPGVQDEVIRSIAPRDFPRANWMGYTKDADSLLQKYWRMVTRGTDAVWFWRWDCIGRFHGWLAPDLRPYPAVQEILRDTQILRDGLGDLLLKSKMQDDGIAMLYSYPSTFAVKLENGPSFGGYETAHTSAHTCIRDLGLQFRYVTDRMLRRGEFEASKYKILLLMRAEAMSDEAAAVIRSFANAGGTVIADVRPGIYDGHCKPRANGVLDDLFGIKRTAPAEAREVEAGEYGTLKMDPAVQATKGEAGDQFDGIPAFITNQVGTGSAMLLNCDMGSYPKANVESTPEAPIREAKELLAEGGVTPAYEVVDDEGRRERNIETIRWRNGDIEIVALFRQTGDETEATVRLPAARHVYDLRNGKALGNVKGFNTRIIPCRASFFAILPGPAPAPKLTVSPTKTTRGTVATGAVSVPDARGLHAFHIQATCGGQGLDWLEQVVVAGDKPVEFAIPICYNDPSGKYQISATDVFTNDPTVASVHVSTSQP